MVICILVELEYRTMVLSSASTARLSGSASFLNLPDALKLPSETLNGLFLDFWKSDKILTFGIHFPFVNVNMNDNRMK